MSRIGYFTIEDAKGKQTLLSYGEFYDRPDSVKEQLRTQFLDGQVRLFCSCSDCEKEKRELTVTKNHIIRVKSNGQQAYHKDSCPKSELYATWIREHQSGAYMSEDGRFCFMVSIPSGEPSASGTSNSSSSSAEGSKIKQSANVLELVSRVITIAWQKQTYSIRKQIRESYRQGLKPEWGYKNDAEFLRLFYGVCNDVDIAKGEAVIPLSAITYKPSVFFSSDFRAKHLLYARITKLGEIKEERKYQYLTVSAIGYQGHSKSAVRILTQDYQKLIEQIGDCDITKENCMLAGYVRHDCFSSKTGDSKVNHYITLIRGGVIFTSNHGMYIMHRETCEKELLELLAEKRILYKRPVLPLEHYGGYIPTLIIEQRSGKDILVDICKSGQMKGKRKSFKNNSEFEVLLYDKKAAAQEIVSDIFTIFEQRKQKK